MLINPKFTIAYKCAACGTYEYFDISLFELSAKKKLDLSCRCKKSSICISIEASKSIELDILCMSCGEEHVFLLDKKDIITKKTIDFLCSKTGMQQVFVGDDNHIREKIDYLEKELDELINFFGYDNYFSNTQVMFDILNKLHDIAERGNLICECGSGEVEVYLLSDKIYLRCKDCPADNVISASSNEDLRHILKKDQIVLQSDEISPKTKKNPMNKILAGKKIRPPKR